MRCPRCGNENTDGNRFCGMCGAQLIAAAQPAGANLAAPRGDKPVETRTGRSSDEPRLPARSLSTIPAREPEVTGPSFLGLNTADGSRERDLYGRSGGGADYLLDDDEEPKSGLGKWVIVLIALMLAGAFGYLHWRQGGFDWVMNGKKPAAVGDTSSATPPPATASPAASDSAVNSTAPASNPASAAPNSPAASDPGSTVPSASSGSTNAQPDPQSATPTVPADKSPAPDDGAATQAPAPPAKKSTEASNDDSSGESESEETEKPAPSLKPAPSIPKARKPTPATPVDTSADAQRYIYGRGVPQDCDRGLRLLKSAAQSDPKAMITMGVLYSSGTCAPRDLPTAYRWFAMALHKDPNNQSLQDDLQQLWGQMTQPERQLAIKLSQ